jgi:hypothetical protein
MDEGPTFRNFVRAFGERWFVAMSGPLSVPLTMIAFFVENKPAKIFLYVTAVGCAVFAAYWVWRVQYQRAKKLEERLRPKIQVSLDRLTMGITDLPTEISGFPQQKGPLSRWIQFDVTCATDAPLEECEAWLVGVERLINERAAEHLVEERVRCGWSQISDSKITIAPLLTQRANLFALYEYAASYRPGAATTASPQIPSGALIEPQTVPQKLRLRDGIKHPGRYRVRVVVAAKDTPSVPASFIFEWRDFHNITIRQE